MRKGFRKNLKAKLGMSFGQRNRLYTVRGIFKTSKYSFDIISNSAGEAHYSYDTLRRIWTSNNTVKCSKFSLKDDHLNELNAREPIGMKCGL